MLPKSKAIRFLTNYKLQILWSIAIILIAYFLFYSVKNISKPSYGFATYYTSSRLLIEGENPADFYNDEYFSNRVKNYVPGIYEIYLINMPTTGLLLLPLATFSYSTSRVLWISFNIILLTLSIILIVRRKQYFNVWLPIVLILVFSFQPLYANVSHAQAYILVFCLLIFSFLGFDKYRQITTGLFVGITIMVKSAGVLLVLLFAIQKRWKSVLWTSITVLIFFIITLPLLGLNSWIVYSDKLANYSSNPSLSVTAYQSIFSFFHHLFIYNKEWNPNPILDMPIVGKSLTIIFSLFVLLFTVINTIKYRKSDIAFGSFIIVGLMLNPASIDYHYLMILVPVFILLDWIRKNQSGLLWLLFILSFFLIALNIPYVSSKVSGRFLALFAYPKLYGALGLWILSLVASGYSKSASLEK